MECFKNVLVEIIKMVKVRDPLTFLLHFLKIDHRTPKYALVSSVLPSKFCDFLTELITNKLIVQRPLCVPRLDFIFQFIFQCTW